MCGVRPLSLVPVRRVRHCWSSPLQGEASPFSPSAGCGPLSWSRGVLPRNDRQCEYGPQLSARGRRTLCPSGGSLRLWLLVARRLPTKSQKPSLLGKASPCHLYCSLDPHLMCAALRSAHIFRGLAGKRDCSFRYRSSHRLARGKIYVRQCYSPLRSVPSFPLAVTAFRSSLPSADTACSAPQSSTESSEPSGRLLVTRRLPLVSAAFPVPASSVSTTELTSRRLPDSHVPPLLPSLPLFRRSASGGVTLISRIIVCASATCRGLRPCLLAFSVPPASRLTPSSLRARNRRACPH